MSLRPIVPLRVCLPAIVLSTPLILLEGCSSHSGSAKSCSGGTDTYQLDGGAVEAGDCSALCEALEGEDVGVTGCSWERSSDGRPIAVQCTGSYVGICGLGRRPASLVDLAAAPSPDAVGEYFAQAARLESAAVRAFRAMVHELASHGAPADLLHAARRGVAEERRHASVMGRLARRFGAAPHRARFGRMPEVRTLESILVENAVEGCVRETYGAAVALWQATHARDPVVARAMAPIAEDETRHAQLSWDIAAWGEARLSSRARLRVHRARVRAIDDLRLEVEQVVDRALVAVAGLPPTASAREFLRRVAEGVAPQAPAAMASAPRGSPKSGQA